MKKIICILLSLVLSCSIIACAKEQENNSRDTSNTEEIIDKVDRVDKIDTPNKQDGSVSIAETVLVDEAGVKITAKSLKSNGDFGPELKVLIENNSETDLVFDTNSTLINGYVIGSFMSAEVNAGKKSNATIEFYDDELAISKISTIADIEISFEVLTSDYDDYLETEVVQIKTSAADTYEYVYDDEGEVLYDGNGVKIIAKGLRKDAVYHETYFVLYVYNYGDKNITLQANDVAANGFMIPSYFSVDIPSDRHAVSSILFSDEDLQEAEIDEITELELSFRLVDTNTWDTITEVETVKVTF